LALTPLLVNQFAGLDLRPSSLSLGANTAVDVLNADFDRPGLVRKRDGYRR
jgi:hypothetical protein